MFHFYSKRSQTSVLRRGTLMGFESIQTVYFRPHSSMPSATHLMFRHNELIPHCGRPTATKRFVVQTVKVKTNSRCALKVHHLNSNLGNNNFTILKVFSSPLSEMQLLYLKLCHNSCLKYSPQLNRSNGGGGKHVHLPNLACFLSRIALDDPRFESRQGQDISLFTKMAIPAVGSTQPSIRYVLGATCT